MMLKILKGKLHRATVTDSKLHYPGSIAVDPDFLEAAGILPYESVIIADLNNGNRLETYVVPDTPGSKRIGILGAAAKLINPGDTVIILCFGWMNPEEAKTHKPKIIVFGENNEIKEK